MGELLDIIVIGAGPAGLSSAEKLAEKGFRVLVLEKEEKPNYEKLCAGYIPAPIFEIFDIPKSLVDYPVRGLKMITRDDEWIVECDDIAGYNVNRTRLAEYLASRIEKKGGEVLTSTTALRIEEGESEVAVACRDRSFKARVVIAADGAYSKIGGRIRGRFKIQDLGLTIQVKSAPSRRLTELTSKLNIIFLGGEFSPFGYAWIFPKKNHVDAGLGALASKTKGSDLRKYLDRVLEYYELKRISKDRYAPVPLIGPLKRIAKGRIVLAGDAAGHVSPLTGEGVKFALIAGSMAAEAVTAYLKGKIPLHKLEKQYLSKLEKSFYKRFRLEKLILKMFKEKKLTSSKLLKDRKMRRIIAELYLDKRDIQKLVLASLPRIFKILL